MPKCIHVTIAWIVMLAAAGLLYVLNLKSRQFPNAKTSQAPQLKWETNATHIKIEMVYPSRGWIAMGLSPNGAMDKSDVLFGYVEDSTGKVVVQDRFLKAPEYFSIDLLLDDQQDWTAVSGSQNATHTKIRAVRKLQTCDSADRPITNAKTHILYAWNTQDPVSETAPIAQHDVRGAYTSNFFAPVASQAPPVGDLTLNFTMHNVTIRAGVVTQFACRYIKVPRIKQKYHIIADRPIIDPRNQKYLHHLLLYWCKGIPEDLTMEPFDCGLGSNKTMPKCPGMRVLGGWAAGGQGTTYSAEAGVLVIPTETEQWVYIQAHYNNVDLKEKEDDSGMSFILTSRLRKHDMGSFGTGAFSIDYLFTLPPGQPDFKFTSHCSDLCTSKGIPTEGITLVSGLLHMHQRGKTIAARHFRGETELPPLLQDMDYDFNFQTVRDVSPPRTFFPGDRIVFECVFNSETEASAVFGGEGTSQEMCMGYFDYYPEVNFTSCGSLYRPSEYFKTIDIPHDRMERQWSESSLSKEVSLQTVLTSDTDAYLAVSTLGPIAESYFANHNWTQEEIDRMTQLYNGDAYLGLCMFNDTIELITNDEPPDIPPLEDLSLPKRCGLGGLDDVNYLSFKRLRPSIQMLLVHENQEVCVILHVTEVPSLAKVRTGEELSARTGAPGMHSKNIGIFSRV